MEDLEQALRDHDELLRREIRKAQPGSRVWFKLEAAQRSHDALYLEIFREPLMKVHCQPPYRGL